MGRGGWGRQEESNRDVGIAFSASLGRHESLSVRNHYAGVLIGFLYGDRGYIFPAHSVRNKAFDGSGTLR